jgi:hypothetical protein
MVKRLWTDWFVPYGLLFLFSGLLVAFSPDGESKELTKPAFDVMKLTAPQIQEIFNHLEKKPPSGKVKRRFLV